MMNDRVFYTCGGSSALRFAATELEMRGLTMSEVPCDAVTHLLLGVPCKMKKAELSEVLETLPKDIRIFGGFLDRKIPDGYRCFDLLKDEEYLARNAAITARCALRVAAKTLPVTLEHCPVLILGWGRIGKCLAPLLKTLGAQVVIAVRNPQQRAIIRALGYESEMLPFPEYALPRFRVIFNTVPFPVLSAAALTHCRGDCLKIELASAPGMEGADIIPAPGLPGTMAPETSGKLIARTVLRMDAQKE